MIRTITTAAIVAAAGITAASAGTLPEGVIVCEQKTDMKRATIAGMDNDTAALQRMTASGGPCLVTGSSYPFTVLQSERHVAQLRIETSGGAAEVWAPAWAAKSDGP